MNALALRDNEKRPLVKIEYAQDKRENTPQNYSVVDVARRPADAESPYSVSCRRLKSRPTSADILSDEPIDSNCSATGSRLDDFRRFSWLLDI